jgi:predicted phosphodiesterase
VSPAPVRIISDIHYAERACRARSIAELDPLTKGVSRLVLNGDTLDTRRGPDNARTARIRAEVEGYFAGCGCPVTFLTGNHDPDISRDHVLELGSGRVLVTHGDVLYDSIVPWSNEAGLMRQRVLQALAALPGDTGAQLEHRIGAFRVAAASIDQRHQSEPDALRYVIRLAGDTVWPPTRVLKILKAWREAPARADSLARRHRPRARVVLIGHTHKPGVWRMPSGVVVVNTGSFCRPAKPIAADVTPGSVIVRRIDERGGGFHAGSIITEIPLT